MRCAAPPKAARHGRREPELPDELRIRLRIGTNLGE